MCVRTTPIQISLKAGLKVRRYKSTTYRLGMREEHLKKFVPITFYSPLSNCAAGSKNAFLYHNQIEFDFHYSAGNLCIFQALEIPSYKTTSKREKLNNRHCEMRQTIESVKACPHAPHKVEYFYISTFLYRGGTTLPQTNYRWFLQISPFVFQIMIGFFSQK